MQVFDLTRPLGPSTPVLEGDPPITLTRVRTHAADGYQVTAIALGSHAGTHLDAPRHFFEDGATLDSFPVDRLVRPGWIIDVRPLGEATPPAPANLMASMSPGPAGQPPTESLPLIGTAASLAAGGGAFGAGTPVHHQVPGEQRVYSLPPISGDLIRERLRDVHLEPGDFLLLWTGGAMIAEDAVPVLAETRAGLIGTDAPSLDGPPYPAHLALLGNGVLFAENLVNLDKPGPERLMCAFLPLPISDADGAPVRAVAWR